jgi:hypothetical protein
MEKEFVPYNIALELKELGFDEPCLAWHNSERLFIDNHDAVNSKMEFDYCCALPLYQQAFRWFREKYMLASQFAYYHVPKWTFEILEFTDIKMTPSKIVCEYSKLRTYEEAEIACLKKLIELVKKL